MGLTQVSGHVQAIAVGQAQVEQHADRIELGNDAQGLAGVMAYPDGVTLVAQQFGQHQRGIDIVVDHHQTNFVAHQTTSARWAAEVALRTALRLMLRFRLPLNVMGSVAVDDVGEVDEVDEADPQWYPPAPQVVPA